MDKEHVFSSHVIKDLTEIDSLSREGKYLITSIGMLSTTSKYKDYTPDEILGILTLRMLDSFFPIYNKKMEDKND